MEDRAWCIAVLEAGHAIAARLLGVDVGNFVIAATKELNEAEAVSERIRQDGDLAICLDTDPALDPRADCDCPGQGGLDIVDDHIDMHRGPVTIVAAQILARADRPLGFFEEGEPNRQTAKLGGPGAQAPRDGQAEGFGIKGDGSGEIRDERRRVPKRRLPNYFGRKALPQQTSPELDRRWSCVWRAWPPRTPCLNQHPGLDGWLGRRLASLVPELGDLRLEPRLGGQPEPLRMALRPSFLLPKIVRDLANKSLAIGLCHLLVSSQPQRSSAASSPTGRSPRKTLMLRLPGASTLRDHSSSRSAARMRSAAPRFCVKWSGRPSSEV